MTTAAFADASHRRLDPGTTKNGEGRVFPLTRELRHVLERQQAIAETLKRERGLIPRYVFCFTIFKKAGQRISEAGFIHQWWKARVAAGCPGRIPHDCRRTAVRNLVRAGVPERVAMQLTGHRTPAVFEATTSSARGISARLSELSSRTFCNFVREFSSFRAARASTG